MDPTYQRAVIDAQVAELRELVLREGWSEASVEAEGTQVFLPIKVDRPGRAQARYVARVDMCRFPVWPYFVGFLDPELPRERWATASDRDPRYWPYSPLPGLGGGFHILFPGPYRVFWCQPCTAEYFFYHRDDAWEPHRWPLSRVASYLRNSLLQAEAPRDWRGIFRPQIVAAATQSRLALPDDAGLGDA